MNYGQIAVDAANGFQQSVNAGLLQAWSNSLKINNTNDKDCPRVAFLGLCEDGFVAGVPKGNYIQKSSVSVIKQKAIDIRNIIMNNNPPSIPTRTKTLIWKQVGGTGQDQGVIDVVYTLFNNGMLL
ncbi:MAG: hypothetical protein SRB1_00004 [Desulfobacteraceae bacterium Eth-SRB1]|nr:MAG: hypothetical protein SRB1_00004 [Desulfobacteraceae bacterium Eth-SRB1]